MTYPCLLLRSLRHFWRTHLAVVAGAAIAVAVLAGALLVGESVRGSLRALALERIGRTHTALAGAHFFREALATELGACPLIALEGVASAGKRTAGGVAVYGVDERFFAFHGVPQVRMPAGRRVWVSSALARELGVDAGNSVLIRMEQPSDIPPEFLHGRRDLPGRAVRYGVEGVLPPGQMGDFSLRLSQADVRAVFVPLPRLQQELDRAGQVNTALFATPPQGVWEQGVTLEDLNLRLRPLAGGVVSVEHAGALLNDAVAAAVQDAAAETGLATHPVFTYVVNTIRRGRREVPYSLAAALDLEWLGTAAEPGDAIVLNDWTARELGARPGDEIELEFYVWDASGGLATRHASFPLADVVPIRGLAADRDLTPEYKGLTDARALRDWDPPFPIDLSRIRPQDEAYWERYRTTPKAFLPLALAQPLWRSRFGKLTAIRLEAGEDTTKRAAFRAALRTRLNPFEHGLALLPVREPALAASAGVTDFGEYFLYFSFFVVVAALLLAGLFFRLGIEQRRREIGLYAALGFSRAVVRKLLLGEGLLLALAGGALGVAAAFLYAGGILFGLTTWWSDAVGTRRLALHPSASALAAGFGAGTLAALGAAAFALRALRRRTPRSLLAGAEDPGPRRAVRPRIALGAALTAACAACGLSAASLAGRVPPAGAFFGSGALVLAAALLAARWWMLDARRARVRSVAALGVRGAAYRRGRSLLCITLIALATFLILSLESFRREATGGAPGEGGFALLAESVLPVYFHPGTPAGRASLSLDEAAFAGVRLFRFRLKPGDDASCLNLYQPRNPRILAPTPDFLAARRFPFRASLARTDREKANPWLLLERRPEGGAIPAIADANSLQYVLHRQLGDTFEIADGRGRPLRVQFVAWLADSLFQSEILISEANFQRWFPERQGYRVFLIDTPAGRAQAVSDALEDGLRDYGFDARPAGERLAQFHRVENAYLSTFQALGGLGLLLGTLGLAAVLIRNVLEARSQLALLQAVGYQPRHLARMVVAENLLLLVLGTGIGVAAALVAIAPVLAERGGAARLPGVVWAPLAVLAAGLAAAWLALQVLRREPLLAALRSE